MKTKIILILLFPLVTNLIMSCCNCEATITQHYTNSSFTLQVLDNSGSSAIVATSDSIIKKAFGIRMQLIRELTARLHKRCSILMQEATASDLCSCGPGKEYLPKDSVISLKIITVFGFDSMHPANSDVSDYFKVAPGDISFETIAQYMPMLNANYSDYDPNNISLSIDFLLMTPPTINTQHQFIIQIMLSDGRMLQQQTGLINLI